MRLVEQEKNSFEMQLTTSNAKYASLQEELSCARLLSSQLDEKSNSANELVSRLKEQNAAAAERIVVIEQQNLLVTDRMAQLERDLSATKDSASKSEVQYQSLIERSLQQDQAAHSSLLQVQELQSELTVLKGDRDDAIQHVNQVQEELAKFKIVLELKDKDLQNLTTQLSSAEQLFKAKTAGSEQEVALLKSQLEQASNRSVLLEQQNSDLSLQLEQARASMSSSSSELREQLDKLINKEKELVRDGFAQTQIISTQQQEITTQQEELGAKKLELSILKQEIEVLSQKNCDLQLQCAHTGEAQRNMDVKIGELEQRILSLVQEKDALNMQLATLSQENATAKQQIIELSVASDSVQQASKSDAKLGDELSVAKEALAAAHESYSATIKALQTELSSLKASAADPALAESLSADKSTADQLASRAKCDELQLQLAEMIAVRSRDQIQFTLLSEAAEAAKAQVSKAEKALEATQAELSTTRSEVVRLSSALQAAETRHSEILASSQLEQLRLKELEDRYARLEAETSRIVSDFDLATSDQSSTSTRLKQEIATIQSENAALLETTSQLQSDLASLTNASSKNQEQIELYRSQLEQTRLQVVFTFLPCCIFSNTFLFNLLADKRLNPIKPLQLKKFQAFLSS